MMISGQMKGCKPVNWTTVWGWF